MDSMREPSFPSIDHLSVTRSRVTMAYVGMMCAGASNTNSSSSKDKGKLTTLALHARLDKSKVVTCQEEIHVDLDDYISRLDEEGRAKETVIDQLREALQDWTVILHVTVLVVDFHGCHHGHRFVASI
ncbi:hypothetical protein L6452_35723 [Arctium lappa]|uniref:Uncharacterized protein n=1 Tax=Arctium lappa TaxID=4217 RepID=A0ACB8Y793_ARCLA|nr:hypothetical protein L6452_35723 [Arctium lappa]